MGSRSMSYTGEACDGEGYVLDQCWCDLWTGGKDPVGKRPGDVTVQQALKVRTAAASAAAAMATLASSSMDFLPAVLRASIDFLVPACSWAVGAIVSVCCSLKARAV